MQLFITLYNGIFLFKVFWLSAWAAVIKFNSFQTIWATGSLIIKEKVPVIAWEIWPIIHWRSGGQQRFCAWQCQAERQREPFEQSLVWPNRGLNLQPPSLRVDTTRLLTLIRDVFFISVTIPTMTTWNENIDWELFLFLHHAGCGENSVMHFSMWLQAIHPSIFYTCLFLSSGSQGSSGAYSSFHRAKAGWQPGHLASSLHAGT